MSVFLMIITMLFSNFSGVTTDIDIQEYAYISDADFNLSEDEKSVRIFNNYSALVKSDFESIDWIIEVNITPEIYDQSNLDDIVTIKCYVLDDAPDDEVIREELYTYLDSGNIYESYKLDIIR